MHQVTHTSCAVRCISMEMQIKVMKPDSSPYVSKHHWFVADMSRMLPHAFTSIPFIFPSLEAHPKYAILLRAYVSRNSAGKGRALLESVGLKPAEIDMCYANHPRNVEEAVQTGLNKWIEKDLPKTWKVLVGAMEHAEIAVQDITELKEQLKKGVYMCACVYISPLKCGCMCMLSDQLLATSAQHVTCCSACQSFSVLTFMHVPTEEESVEAVENEKLKVYCMRSC